MLVFFFNDTATTEIYPLSLHDALPIYARVRPAPAGALPRGAAGARPVPGTAERLPRLAGERQQRSEEHTSELQSRLHLVCRLLLEKKKKLIRPRGQLQAARRHPP